MKWLIILGCICSLNNCKTETVLPPTSSILGLLVQIIKGGWGIIEDRSDINLPMTLEHKERKILHKIDMLDRELSYVSHQITNSKVEAISEIVKYVTKNIKVELKLNDLLQHIDDVDYAYWNMQQYASNKDDINSLTLEDFAKNIISHQSTSIKSLMEKIHKFIVPKRKFLGHSNLLQLLAAGSKDLDSNSVCASNQSPNQLLYNLYNTIALTQMKGYAMIQYSYMLLEMYKKGTFTSESQFARETFINRSIETAREMKIAMDSASAEFWKCDPDKYERDNNYLEITQLLQGYIQNEVDLNPDGTCKENCGYYQYTKSHSCFKNLYCRQQRRCKGRIFNCQYIDSDMWICPSNITSGRRYTYVEYENGRILGNKGSCPNHRVKVDSWWRWLFWHCSYCMCLCDEEGIYSDRYFSLHQAVSDVLANKVVTGVRFVKKNRIIHLQVQQGTLLPHGVIDTNTVEWIAVKDMRITDRFVYNRQDYFTMNWENRAMDLDDLPGKDDYILTGIRFKMIGSHLNFEIRVTPFDFQSGKLISPREASEWMDNTNTEFSDDKRTKINLNKVDVPTKSKSPSEIKSKHNQFIEFTHTDFDKDAAQTTVPFIDSQSVIPILPLPISGAGIYFKTRENFGGFIGLKIMTYNFSKHLNITLDKPELLQPEPNSN